MPRHQIRLDSRFIRKVQRTEGCWEWTGARNDSGYGAMSVGRRTLGAHRVAWTLFRGPLADGDRVHHLCGNRGCVRPDHLELGSADSASAS